MINNFLLRIKFIIFFGSHKMSRNIVKCRLRPLKSYSDQKYMCADLIQLRVYISTILQKVLEICKIFSFLQNFEKCCLCP